MQRKSRNRRLTIPKFSKIYKQLEAFGGGRKLAHWPIFCVFITVAYQGQSQVAHIGERVPIRGSWQYQLEIASDPGFSQVLHTANVTSVPYIWNVPASGVYHWRLDRPPEGAGSEASSVASGSFVALAQDAADAGPARMSWDAYPGADRYVLMERKGDGGVSRLSTGYPGLVLPTIRQPIVLEVIPHRGGTSLQRDFKLDPSLTLHGQQPDPDPIPAPVVEPPVAAVAEQSQPLASEPAPEEGAPSPAEEQPPTEPVAESTAEPVEGEAPKTDHDLAPETVAAEVQGVTMPSHRLWLSGTAVQENLRAQKLEIDLDSTGTLYGFMGGFRTTPVSGLTIGAWGRYHDHKTEIAYEESSGITADLTIAQTLVRADALLGWDLLQGAGIENHSLVMAVAFTMHQFPRLSYVFAGGPGVIPPLEREEANFPGGFLSYGILLGSFLLEAEGTVADRKDPEIRTARGGAALSYFWNNGVGLRIDYSNERIIFRHCAEDAAECLREGKVRTTIQDNSFALGVTYGR